tara:strand:+ start:295 stop:663 length:369 start_codon:yes stop_codon:yes gene_type:complete
MKVSPHVTIYKFPIGAITSVMNRITGASISVFFIGGGLSHLYGYNPISIYDSLNNYQKPVVDFTILFPSVYHTFGGLRHFIWDKYPQYLTNPKVTKSSYSLLGISFVSSGILSYSNVLRNII